MKTLLLTGYDDNLREIGDITSRIMSDYATHHWIDFLRIRQYDSDSHPSWQKAEHVYRQLKAGYDCVMWLDADTLITNSGARPFTRPYELGRPHSALIVSKDWGLDATEDWHFSMGNFIAYRDANSNWETLWPAILDGKFEWANAPLWEQSRVQQLYRRISDKALRYRNIDVAHQRFLNSVHSDLAPSAPEPWQPGDFLCHLTGEEITNEKRMVVLKKLIEDIYP